MLCSVWRVKIELLPFGGELHPRYLPSSRWLADLTSKHQDRAEEPTRTAAAAATAVMIFEGRTGTTVPQDIYKTSIAQREE